MNQTADQIRTNAEKLRSLNLRIHETVKFRSRSPSARAEWEAACAEFHAQYGVLFFPGGEVGWSAFMSDSVVGIELAIRFLDVDQYTHRSGYHKQIIWDRLKKLYLTPEEKNRLEDIAIAYLQRQVRREFWHMVNFMRKRASPLFWRRIETLAMDRDGTTALKARWLLLARLNAPVRRWIGSEIFRPKYEPGYVPHLDFGWLAPNF